MQSLAILALAVGAVVAQQGLGDLPQCGQTCITNMVSIANTQFGCGTGDVACYCNNVDFGNGVRDCSTQACQNAGDAASVIAFGSAYCASALPSATTGALPILSSALATLTGTGAPAPTITGTTLTATTSAPGDASSLISSLNSAASSLASVASSLESSIESAASSASESASNAASSVASSIASHLSSAISSATGAPTGGAAAAPMMTGLPLAGAAGVAAWLLL